MAKSRHTTTVDFSRIVFEKRAASHLSQSEAAELLGVSVRTVQNWEAGSYPWPRHRRAILQWANGVEAA
jgi:DNA-binding transcriptional regulator YiaG